MLPDAIYRGWVQHRRYVPHLHQFKYPIAMLMLDLDTLQTQFRRSRLWSLERFNLISFYRRDYLQHPEPNLKCAVQKLIETRCGESFEGTIKILTHPRYLGFIFNPVTFYFCFNTAQHIRFIVVEINNTPWNERYAYVLQVDPSQPSQTLQFEFDKQFHVSPFMPMAIHNHWQFSFSQHALNIEMHLTQQDQKHFDATLNMTPQLLNRRAMRWLPFQYPLQTVLVMVRIYWQALRLWCKKTPFVNHPDAPPDQIAAIKSGNKHKK